MAGIDEWGQRRKTDSRRELLRFNTREEALDWLAADSSLVAVKRRKLADRGKFTQCGSSQSQGLPPHAHPKGV